MLPDIQEEELGDKSIQAEEAGIKVKDFDTYQEYVKAIRDFQIDPEKTKRISLDEKLAKALELEIIMLMKEKPEISVKPCMDLIANHIDFFTPVKVEAFCKLLMEDNKLIDNIEKVVAKNERNPEIFKTAYATLANIEKQIDPAISDNEAIKRASKFFQNHEDVEVDGIFVSDNNFKLSMFDKSEVLTIYSNIIIEEEKTFQVMVLEIKSKADYLFDLIVQLKRDAKFFNRLTNEKIVFIGFVGSGKVDYRLNFKDLLGSMKCVLYLIKDNKLCGRNLKANIDWTTVKCVKKLTKRINQIDEKLDIIMEHLGIKINDNVKKEKKQ